MVQFPWKLTEGTAETLAGAAHPRQRCQDHSNQDAACLPARSPLPGALSFGPSLRFLRLTFPSLIAPSHTPPPHSPAPTLPPSGRQSSPSLFQCWSVKKRRRRREMDSGGTSDCPRVKKKRSGNLSSALSSQGPTAGDPSLIASGPGGENLIENLNRNTKGSDVQSQSDSC